MLTGRRPGKDSPATNPFLLLSSVLFLSSLSPVLADRGDQDDALAVAVQGTYIYVREQEGGLI